MATEHEKNTARFTLPSWTIWPGLLSAALSLLAILEEVYLSAFLLILPALVSFAFAGRPTDED
jgi:hypothetical protein